MVSNRLVAQFDICSCMGHMVYRLLYSAVLTGVLLLEASRSDIEDPRQMLQRHTYCRYSTDIIDCI